MQAQDVLYIAFREARILQRPQALNSMNELQDGLIFLNQQLDYWAARGCYAWTSTFVSYTLTAGHQPHLIGPGLTSPDFASTGNRPVRIHSCNLILTNATPNVDIPINIRDGAWWAANRVKTIQSSVPTDVYYEAGMPNGALYFWPVPNFPYGLRLELFVVLQQFVNLTDTFLAPPAYLRAVTLSLAEELCDIWGTQCPAGLPGRAMKARDALQSNNYLAPRIASADWGTFSAQGGD